MALFDQFLPSSIEFQFSSEGSNNVRSSMSNRSKPKIGCLSLINKRWTCSSLFDVRKNYVWVCSMSNLKSLVKALLKSMFDVPLFEAKNWVLEFDHPLMNMFEFVQCSFVWSQSSGVRVWSSINERVQIRLMFKKWCSRSINFL